MKKQLSISSFVFFFASLALAQSSTMSTGSSAATADSTQTTTTMTIPAINQKFEDNKEITDAKIRADAGSMSKYSVKFSLGYYGPTIDDMSKSTQPNPDHSISPKETALSGSIGARYRFDKKSTLSFGSGLSALTPFNGIQRVDTNSPFVSYDLTNRFDNLQMRNSFGTSYITVPNYTKVGEYAAVNWDSSIAYNIGDSRFALSLDSSLADYIYNRGYVKSDGRANRWSWSLYPGMKYNLNDKINFNTSWAIGYINLRSRADTYGLENSTITQRLGIGWAIQPDIYFAPYLTVYPNNIATDSTTFNFSTVFSIL